ncbi:histidine phosphatase family protein [Pseudoduganella umbonata]|uniref:Histidine phosphatase family protein n=1 Tax=Pseudoduganella umbonata TaxID=864828 RepID=A0A4P8HP38_9BURK|nr:histidine phosphatase family protein [Pseudoduganella umbonata]MBB3221012.1 phosphohistidine phosphatase SixA [Pseudoduganella umbonata]QCP10218.1 histidine phosphatase family protein [Pseudoduganella umbonata]
MLRSLKSGLRSLGAPAIGVLAALSLHTPLAGADEAGLWKRLSGGGHVVVMRHAVTTPGIGDPAGFRLGDCATQRNLSPAGRADAQAIGAAFRRHAVPVGRVLTSRWCRCVETAKLAFGRAEPADMVDSIWQEDDAVAERKVASARKYAAAWREPGNLVLVTHDVNVRALTGTSLAQGEMVVARARADGGLEVLGTLGVPGPAR